MRNIFCKYFWKDCYYGIRNYLFPRQEWLTTKFKNSWQDKDSIVELVILECIKHYVETELGREELFNKNRWSKSDNVPEHQLKFENELKDIYLIVTKQIPLLEKELEKEWNNIPEIKVSSKKDYNRKYKKIERLEQEKDLLMTDVLKWAVLNRGSMRS